MINFKKCKTTKGSSLAEYGLLVALIVGVSIFALPELGRQISSTFFNSSDGLELAQNSSLDGGDGATSPVQVEPPLGSGGEDEDEDVEPEDDGEEFVFSTTTHHYGQVYSYLLVPHFMSSGYYATHNGQRISATELGANEVSDLAAGTGVVRVEFISPPLNECSRRQAVVHTADRITGYNTIYETIITYEHDRHGWMRTLNQEYRTTDTQTGETTVSSYDYVAGGTARWRNASTSQQAGLEWPAPAGC